MCVLQPAQKPLRITRSACSLPLSAEADVVSYSFGNGERVIVESRHAPYPLKRPILEWEIRSCRMQERERIHNYEYMPNRLQRGAEIYRRHLEMKAKSQQ